MANKTIYPFGTNGTLPSSIGVVNDLTTGGTTIALSAEQGKVLGERTGLPMIKVQPSISGTIKDTDGSDWDVGGYWRTPYVRLDTTKPLYAKGDSNQRSRAFVAFYNDNLAFISAVNNVGSADEEHQITIPEGATLARSTCTTAQKDGAYLTQKVQPVINDEVLDNKAELEETIDLLKDVPTNTGALVDGKVSGTLCKMTDYIRIDDSLELELYVPKFTASTTNIQVIAFYSAKNEGSYISGIQKTAGVTYKCLQILTIPQGAKWVRLCAISVSELAGYTLKCKRIDYIKVLSQDLNCPDYVPARFLLPQYMDVVVGRQCDFWVDDTIENPLQMPCYYDIPSGVTNYGNGHLRITAGNVGTGNLTLNTLKNNNAEKFDSLDNIVNKQDIIIRRVARTGGSGTKNILIVGDSLVEYNNGANPAETYKLLAEDGDVTINQIGTQISTLDGATYRHEGRAGWSWAKFINDAQSPFVFNGVLSFSQYMETNFPSLSGIDMCIVMLGTNDNRTVVIKNAKVFIDKLLTDYPACKVAVGIPAYGRPYKGNRSSMERGIRYEAKNYLDTFDNGRYHANVTCIGQGCWIDRENDYPHEEIDSTPYSTAKIIRYTNDVHPLAQGNKQWGRAVYCKIRSWIAGNL